MSATYLVTAYRWGWYNASSYVVYCGNNYDRAAIAAEYENDSRAGKYGVIVQQWDGGELKADLDYFPSSYGEKELSRNWRLDYINDLGHILLDYIDGNMWVSDADAENPNRLKLVKVDIDPMLEERALQKKSFYDKLSEQKDTNESK